MLTYRAIDYKNDIEDVIDLLRKFLDPTFTKEYFKWKHLENPFGKSIGLLALDGDKVVGVRMFMIWKFKKDDRLIRAIRPVDTATDAKYRGRGVFTQLTLDGLNNYRGKYDFVFNTPNKNSLPGNLKMGWQKFYNGINFQIGLVNFFSKSLKFEIKSIENFEFGPTLINYSDTFCSKEFIKWRYQLTDYKLACFEKPNHYLIYKQGKIKGLPIIIVYEIMGEVCMVEKMLNSLGKKYYVPGVYFYYPLNSGKIFIKSFSTSKPVIVVKNMEPKFNNQFRLSLGDLESVI
ncbi:GNAT family N-acetyltransferase [Christiangramia salexigens]|uniref:Uncharacterized protein n=1 Tax=Christiangramia salexigens TaxID=1913577 RepID=A0A1L3J2C4_9FLAO|nr:GNAT family N-acetyltransferase [Christiangramia salexigens]APG59274.1 hypothetical protein LPB144_02100 [Christiangramia salexigens]